MRHSAVQDVREFPFVVRIELCIVAASRQRYGTFPRVLGRYVRELKVLTLEEAIRRMTSLAADQIGQPERGRIAERMYADIVVFDCERIADRATYPDPHQYSVGIHDVIVNGVPIIRKGALTGAKPGRVLKGPARRAIIKVLRSGRSAVW